MFLAVQVTTSSSSVRMSSSEARASSRPETTSMVTRSQKWGLITAEELAQILRQGCDRMLVIDSRSFLEYNTCHVKDAINVCCSKLVKRRLQHDKVSIKDLLAQACRLDLEEYYDIVVYDQCSNSTDQLSSDCFLMVLLSKLVRVFHSVVLLKGGFLNFQASHPSLCESKSTCSTSSGNYKCTPLTSMSQPCLPVSNIGPTKILPFLYLGSQQDALSQDTTKDHGVNYVLNVSTTCPKPHFIKDNHFHRIPVNDNYSDKLLPHFKEAFQFIDKVREANGCVLVHCLAGISRSPTLAIAYVMKYMNTTSEEAYKYVKDKRPTISPNFNFLGQLMEYEKQMKQQQQQQQQQQQKDMHSLDGSSENAVVPTSSLGGATKKGLSLSLGGPGGSLCRGMKKSFSLNFAPQREKPVVVQSPTTALARLNFNSAPSPIEESTCESPLSPQSHLNFPQFPTTSLDKLSFTPCFAKEDQTHVRQPSGGSTAKSSGGTKRPLCTSNADNPQTDCSPCSGSQTSCNSDKGTTSMMKVVCRSPETKAKRPLVRPNSIAFSSYPKFDFSEQYSKCPAAEQQQQQQKHTASSSICSTPDKMSSDTSLSEVLRNPENLALQMCTKESEPGGGLQNLARKSQSLEDILNSQEEEEGAEWMAGMKVRKRGKHSYNTMHAADVFSQPLALERVQGRCRGPSDPHQSSSSISSSGSHNSLQGSLEMIPVS